MKLRRRQELETTIEKVAFGGQGIAHHDDMVVFVDDALPGDRMKVRLRKVKKKFAHAYPLEILQPSELRIEAPCQHFEHCGGCKWQNVDYKQQLQFKKQFVVESLEHIGSLQIQSVHEVLPSPLIFGYRNKMEFSFADNRWLPPEELKNPEIKKDILSLGFHVPRQFNRIIDIEKCWLQDDEMNKILQFTKDYFRGQNIPVYHNRRHEGILRYLVLRKSFAFQQIMVNVVTSQPIPEKLGAYAEKLIKAVPNVVNVINNINSGVAQIARGEQEVNIYGESLIREKLGEYLFEISSNSFFQTNSVQAENLYRTIKQYAEVKGGTVWDLYCGTGSIAIFLSREAETILGFEIMEDSVRDARRNAEINNITNCQFVSGDLRFSMEKYSDASPDVIVCDPPRSGMHPKVLEMLLKIAPQRIVYVSCNPTTLARDLKLLNEKYYVAEVQPVDMFPQTYHVETVCCLERK